MIQIYLFVHKVDIDGDKSIDYDVFNTYEEAKEEYDHCADAIKHHLVEFITAESPVEERFNMQIGKKIEMTLDGYKQKETHNIKIYEIYLYE